MKYLKCCNLAGRLFLQQRELSIGTRHVSELLYIQSGQPNRPFNIRAGLDSENRPFSRKDAKRGKMVRKEAGVSVKVI